MIRTYSLEALVLRKEKMGETDNIITVFSKSHGLLRLLAKGIRKITSRRAPYLDLFNYVRLYLNKGKTFDLITDVTLVNNFLVLKSDIKRVACAFKMAELLNRLLPEGQSQKLLYDRLISDYEGLNNLANLQQDKILTDFSNFLLSELGYAPKDKFFTGLTLDGILEEVMEKKINSNQLLSKLI